MEVNSAAFWLTFFCFFLKFYFILAKIIVIYRLKWYNHIGRETASLQGDIFVKYTVLPEDNGRTVKEILRGRLGLSSALIKHLKFLENGIMLGEEKVTVRRTVSTGDVLSLAVEDRSMGEALTPTDIPLSIIYEDEQLVIPNKPPFMPTHPSHLHHGDTLADALSYRYRNCDIPFVFRPINRLDRNTSGLTLIARNRISAARLTEAMRSGRIKKQYLAVLSGTPTQREGLIDTYMRRTAKSIIVRENCGEGEGGDRALTRYRVLFSSGEHCLVLASPITGRTHQLRVHFAGLGCPIVGDDIYGSTHTLIPRHALHALTLTLPHPTTNEDMTVTAPLPEDMQSLIRSLFGKDLCLDGLYSEEIDLSSCENI